MSKHRPNVISKTGTPRHGHIFSPKSRAYFAWEAGELDEGALNQRESGKFFPQTARGLPDAYAASDVSNAAPPPDGKIASANQPTGEKLDRPGDHWHKHPVRSHEMLEVSWRFSANHVSRRWNYFITKAAWDPHQVLSRAQFEAEPFYVVQINLKPYWEHSDEMMPITPTTHEVPLPNREGYHVLLAVWEVADTPNAFYQVVDLDFVPSDGGGERPSTPTGLAAGNITDKQVVLTWNAATGPSPIADYRITRNGTTTVDIEASLLTWTDYSVVSETTYNYFVSAIDDQGRMSAPSQVIEVHTLGEDAAPTAPKSLHSMGQTAHSISLMWGAATGTLPIAQYLIFRGDHEVQRVGGTQTSFEDTSLTPDTEYLYVVKALDQNDKLSLPSNVLKVKTRGTGEGGEHPQWAPGKSYTTNARVSYEGGVWRCLQAHISYTTDWAPGQPGSEVLWARQG